MLKSNTHSDNSVNDRSFALSTIFLMFYVFTTVAWANVSSEFASYSQYVGIALALVFFAELLLSRKKFHLPKGLILIALFVLWNGLSFFWAANPTYAYSKVITLVQLLIFVIVGTNLMILRGSVLPALISFLVGVLITMWVIYQTNDYGVIQHTTTRLGGLLANANSYAMALTLGGLFTLYLIRYYKSKAIRLFLIGSIILEVLQIYFFSGSVKGMLGVILVVCVFTTLYYGIATKRAPHQTLLLVILGIMLYFAFSWLIQNTPYTERLTNYQSTRSFQNRENFIGLGVGWWQDSPIIGYGSNQFRVMLDDAIGRETYAHNNYIEIGVNNGLLGIIIFYGVHIYLVFGNIKALKDGIMSEFDFAWSMTTIALVLFFDIASVSYYNKVIWITLSILIAHLTLSQKKYFSIQISDHIYQST